MPLPAIGVLGYTTTRGVALAARDTFWLRPRLMLGAVPDTTMGGKACTAPGASCASADSLPANRHIDIDTRNRNRALINPIPFRSGCCLDPPVAVWMILVCRQGRASYKTSGCHRRFFPRNPG